MVGWLSAVDQVYNSRGVPIAALDRLQWEGDHRVF